MRFQTDRSRAHGLGSAKEGSDHWWAQRVTSVALAPLGLLFVFPLAMTIGEGHEAALALYANPFHAIVAGLFLITAFNHLRLGLQVVIEDYVHGPMRTVSLLAVTFFCAAFALAGVFGVAKIAFTG